MQLLAIRTAFGLDWQLLFRIILTFLGIGKTLTVLSATRNNRVSTVSCTCSLSSACTPAPRLRKSAVSRKRQPDEFPWAPR